MSILHRRPRRQVTHPPDLGLTEDHPLPAPSNPGPKGPTDKSSPLSSSTKLPSDEYSPSWSKGSTKEYSPSWSKGSTDIYSAPTSPSTGDSHLLNPGLTEDHLPVPSNPGPKGSTDESFPLSSSIKLPSDEYSPSWSKGSTEEYPPSWSKGSTDIYSAPTSSPTGDSHPPNLGLTEVHPPEALTGAHPSTNDHPPPPSPEPQRVVGNS